VLDGLAILGVSCDALIVAQLLTARGSGDLWPLNAAGLSWVGPVWFSSHALLFLGWLAFGALRSIGSLATRARSLVRALDPARLQAVAAQAVDPSRLESPARRELLERAALAGAGLPFFVSLSGVPLSYDFRVDEHQIEVPGWPRELDGFRVVHLSDIHVGGGMDRDRLLRMAELTQAARPDLVAHTGDFLTHRSGDFDTPLYEAIARIKAPYGQWACLGNHDFDDAEKLTRRLADAGVGVLRNQLASIDANGVDLEIAGFDFIFQRDQHARRYAELTARLGPRSDAPRILLNHDPRTFFSLPSSSADLMLAGHTHGGHVGIQLGHESALTVVGLFGIPDQGVFSRDDMRLFVTRCVGFYGYPMRVGIPPEIAVLVLRAPQRITSDA
jgi:predicted MPP superfamily phosphohydrolase